MRVVVSTSFLHVGTTVMRELMLVVGATALSRVPAFLHDRFTLMLQKNPESESVRD